MRYTAVIAMLISHDCGWARCCCYAIDALFEWGLVIGSAGKIGSRIRSISPNLGLFSCVFPLQAVLQTSNNMVAGVLELYLM